LAEFVCGLYELGVGLVLAGVRVVGDVDLLDEGLGVAKGVVDDALYGEVAGGAV